MPITFQTEQYTETEILDSLHPFVREWFTTSFKEFSPPQRYAIRNIQQGINSLISSPTGSGKCITPDTTMLIEEGGFVKFVTGNQLIDKTIGKQVVLDLEKEGKLYHIPSLKSFSFNGHFLEKQPAMIFHQEYNGEIIRFKTQYGREVKVSPDHPLLVERSTGPCWIPAKDIQEGDRLGVPRQIELPEKPITLPWDLAISTVKEKAKYVVDYKTYFNLKEITKGFTVFDIDSDAHYHLQLLLGKTMKQIANETGISLTTIHQQFQGKTSHGKQPLHALFSTLREKTFERNQLIVQGNDGKVVEFFFPISVDERIARWIAFVTAEGFIGEYKTGSIIAVCQTVRKSLLRQFLEDTKNLFGLEFKQKNEKDYVLQSTYASRFIATLLGIAPGRGRHVDLPDWLLNCKKEYKTEFLRVFFSLEAEARSDQITLVQASKQKIEIINYLLLSLGIFCSLSQTEKYATNSTAKIRRVYHRITVIGIGNLSKILELEIDHQNMHLIAQYCKGKPSGKIIARHSFNYKKISALAKNYTSYDHFKKDMGSAYEVARRTGFISEDSINKINPIVAASGNQQLLLELSEMTSANLMWLEVIEKESLNYRGRIVDLSVPGLQNFVGGFGGMYLHNTLSAFLAILNELVTRADTGTLEDKVYCIYLSPLKALANDINRNLKEPLSLITEIAKKYGRELNIRVGTRTGDTTTSERTKMLATPPHILITTPESLAITLSSIKFSKMLITTRFLIIDEIHALAENKRGTHLSLSIERLAKHATFTRIGLSATVAPLEEIAKFLVGYEDPQQKIFRDCRIVDVQYLKKLDLKVLSPVEDMMRTTHVKMQDATYTLLHELIQSHRTTLVFTNTRSGTERVVHQLKDRYPASYANVLDADEEQEVLREKEGLLHENLEKEAELDVIIENPQSIQVQNSNLTEAVKRKNPKNLIGAHHGSLSKQHRLKIENMLKEGSLKSVVCSTSLELGIDIGFIDLVILIGSPKSVARALQRIGRSGHKLHEEAKGRIIVMDRDDLVECSVLLKAAIEKKIDKVSIPKNALDVLAQHLFGMAIEDQMYIEDAWNTIKSSYVYEGLTRKDFEATLQYLAGEYTQLSERNIYSKIWIDREQGTFGKKGKLARLIYMTNIGTIPDETSVQVKINEHTIGTITEDFMERLKPGDIFVLGGEPYEFKFGRGMTIQVKTSAGRMPTVPNWISEMLPLSYDLAMEIQSFRKYMDQWFRSDKPKEEICDWLRSYLYVDERGIEAIYQYFREQHKFCTIPHRNRILLEHFKDGNKKYVFIHSVYGRRVNDVLARATAYINGKLTGRDVEIGITDNGFYLKSTQPVQALRAIKLVREEELYKLMEVALDKSEVLKRRFRHCAGRALMILRTYKGQSKSVGRQQISSQLIMSAVRRISNDFPILKEARREILEDLMDIRHAAEVVREIQSGSIEIEERSTDLPSPFAFNMVVQGYVDILKMEDRIEFIRRMHELVLQEIEGKKPSKKDALLPAPEFTYERLWNEQEAVERKKAEDYQGYLKDELRAVARKIGLDADIYYHASRLLDGETNGFPEKFKEWLHTLLKGTIPKVWKDDLVRFFIEKERLI